MIMNDSDRTFLARQMRIGDQIIGRPFNAEQPPYVTQAPDYVARWGATPPPEGTVLRWTESNGATWIATCNEPDSWTSDHDGMSGDSFAELARLIANHPCDVAIAWRAVPQVEARPAGDDAVRDWASQFITAQDTDAEGPA